MTSMRLVVTGGGGFVMANVLRHWLQAEPAASAILVDAAPLDAAATAFFAPVRDRLEVVRGDVASAGVWQLLPQDAAYVVHGAAVTPHPYVDASGRRHEPEREDPLRVLEANILGTGRALTWARSLPGLRRFVYVSTGSVYADSVPEQERRPFPLPEDGYIGPHGLYDITKYASELITRRIGELDGLPTVIVRLSSVFGPLDRATPARNVRNMANLVAHAAIEGRPLRAVSADAVGDYVYAPDVAEALRRLLLAPATALHHAVYNIACGETATLADLVAHAAAVAPGLTLAIVEDEAAEVRADAGGRTGRWAAYDISRAAADLGWRPRPLAEAMRDHIEWLRRNPET